MKRAAGMARAGLTRLTRRPWHAAVAALAGGLALAPAVPPQALLLPAAGLVAAAAALRAPGIALALAGALVGGSLVGSARIEAIDRPGQALRPGSALHARALLLARPRRSTFGWSAEVQVRDGRAAGARLLARGDDGLSPPRAPPGAVLELRGTIEPPDAGEGFDWRAHLRRRGIAAELALSSLRPTGERRGGAAGLVDRLRTRAEAAIDRSFPPARAALVRGMVLGQDERIDPLVRDDFRDSGLAHLLAVSGQNVMLLVALALPLLGMVALGPGARTAALLCLIALYVPLAGAGPSIQRAAVMGAAGLVAVMAARPASRSYALALAAVATLALNPRVAGDPGWQLSFAAVAGIIWIVPMLRPALRALPRPLVEGAAITLAATLATAPLIAHHFGSLPLATVPANLLALPAVPVVMWAGMLQSGLGQAGAGAGAIGALAESASGVVGWFAGPAVDYLAWLARTCAELPGSTLALPLANPAAVAGAYAGLALVLLAVRHSTRLRRALRPAPDGHELAAALRRVPAARRLGIAAAAAALLALGTVLALRPPAAPGRLTVRFLDVGQGDATLVQHPDGTALLFDAGPPEARTVRLLRAAGVRRLAVVVATHASRDHHGGLAEVIERVPVDLLMDGGDGSSDPDFRAVVRAARERGVRHVPALAPLELHAGPLTIRVLSPGPRPPGPPPEDPNPRAVVALVSSGEFDLLLSADAESEALMPLPLPDVEAMKVPHHGSADPGLSDVLARLRPEMAAIEVGENGYGHPAPSTLAALRRAGVPTWRTDRHGTVTLTADGGELSVAAEHQR